MREEYRYMSLNSLDKFENGIFYIERDGEVIQLYEEEIEEFRKLGIALNGRFVLDNYNTESEEANELIARMKENESICYDIETAVIGNTAQEEDITVNQYIKKYRQLEKTELSNFVFDDELMEEDESISGYLWATDDLVQRLCMEENIPADRIENINFYPIYEPETGHIKVETSFYYRDEHIERELYLTDKEKEALILEMDHYSVKTYNASIFGMNDKTHSYFKIVNEITQAVKDGILKLNPEDRNSIFIYHYQGENSPEGWYSENILDVAHKLCDDPEKYRKFRYNMRIEFSFKLWIKTLSSEEINLVDKLKNLRDNEIIGKKIYRSLMKNKEDSFPAMEAYIKNHTDDYRWFIMNETERLFDEGVADWPQDWQAGLYNCDMLYMNAIDDFSKSFDYERHNEDEMNFIEKVKVKVREYLIDSDEEDKRIDYIFENPENGEVESIVNDGIEEMKLIKMRTDKWVVTKVWEVPDWDFNFDEYFFNDIEKGKKLLFVGDECNWNLWAELDEFYPENIEHKKGVHIYLQYCADHGITREYLEQAVGLDTKDIKYILNEDEELNVPSEKDRTDIEDEDEMEI